MAFEFGHLVELKWRQGKRLDNFFLKDSQSS